MLGYNSVALQKRGGAEEWNKVSEVSDAGRGQFYHVGLRYTCVRFHLPTHAMCPHILPHSTSTGPHPHQCVGEGVGE
jgi:hypothetical protein